jgi:head-tail adaptor
MVDSGALTDKFAAERRPSDSRNDSGEIVSPANWDEVCRFYGSYEAGSYIEQEQMSTKAHRLQATVRTRYDSRIAGGMRLRWLSRGGRLLYISSVVERSNRTELEITVEEEVA